MDRKERGEALTAWCDKFYTAPTTRDFELTGLCRALELSPGLESVMVLDMEEQPLFRIGSLRAAAIGLKVRPSTLALLTYITRSPGNLVMYLYALRHEQVTWPVEVELTVQHLFDLFPQGFVTDDALSTLWDKQKVDVGGQSGVNLLDIIDPATDFIMTADEALTMYPN